MQTLDLGQFADMYGKHDFLRISEITAPSSYEVFIERLYFEIDGIIQEVEKGKKERKDDSEDRLTMEIVSCLNSAGYIAEKDPTQGGHVDMLVVPKQKRQMRWLGEAKIWKGVAYLQKGMDQLIGRYSSGREGNLGLLVYFKESDLVGKMKDWKTYLESLADVKVAASGVDCDFKFETRNPHATGTTVTVRHLAVNIYWPY